MSSIAFAPIAHHGKLSWNPWAVASLQSSIGALKRSRESDLVWGNIVPIMVCYNKDGARYSQSYCVLLAFHCSEITDKARQPRISAEGFMAVPLEAHKAASHEELLAQVCEVEDVEIDITWTRSDQFPDQRPSAKPEPVHNLKERPTTARNLHINCKHVRAKEHSLHRALSSTRESRARSCSQRRHGGTAPRYSPSHHCRRS